MGSVRYGVTRDLFPVIRQKLGFTELAVAFQPLIDLSDGKLFAFEALARVQHPEMKSPVALISAALHENIVGELGRLLRSLAVTRCPGHALFLNVHPRELDEGWLTRPDDPIFGHEHPIYLEITESVPMSKGSHCNGTIAEVRDRGARIVIDDLGAGYSNLKYIADLAPDVVKLDRELIRDMASTERAFRLVRSITRLCIDLGARVVAEGIETAEELDAARRAGVHFAQGYFIGRPSFDPEIPTLPLAV